MQVAIRNSGQNAKTCSGKQETSDFHKLERYMMCGVSLYIFCWLQFFFNHLLPSPVTPLIGWIFILLAFWFYVLMLNRRKKKKLWMIGKWIVLLNSVGLLKYYKLRMCVNIVLGMSFFLCLKYNIYLFKS